MSTQSPDRPARISTPNGNGRQRRSGDPNDPDPFDEIPGIAPNMGQDVLPHVVTFQGLLRNVARTYYVSDEAMQHSWENARFMRNDPGIMECLEQRQRSTALLGWHLEADDEDDPNQVMLVDEMTAILKQTPNFLKYRECLLHALWYGKYGVAHTFRWKQVKGRMRVVLNKWRPVNGDKIVFRYDDGTPECQWDTDQVGIRVGSGYTAGSQIANRWTVERVGKIQATDHGLAYFLEHWERTLLAIHKHMIEDAEYEAPERAGAIHGVGIRSRLYWLWYQKQETMAWLMEYLERSAFGIEIWTYPAGNKEAFDQTKKAAQERIGLGRNIVLVPRHPDSDVLSSDVKRIEPGMAGADILDRIIREYFGWQIKRYILGQILTSETASTGLGSGVATIHLDTYLQIVRYDATNLAETITTDTVQPLIRYNWPHLADLPVKFVIETEAPDIEGKLGAWQTAYEMGLKLKAADVAELIGAQIAQPGEEALVEPGHAQQAAMQQGQAGQGQSGLVGLDGRPLRPTTAEEDAAKLYQALAGVGQGPEQYRALRPGMERIIYDRRGRVKRIERYRATQDKPEKSGGNEPGWRTIGGGANVFIGAGGQILAGCPGLEGEDLDDLGEDEEPKNRRRREHRQDVAEHHGLKGEDLDRKQVKQLEDHPHPETGKDADGQRKSKPVAGKVQFRGKEYEVRSEAGSWFFRVDQESGWTMASEETAAEIERQLGRQSQAKEPEAKEPKEPKAETPQAETPKDAGEEVPFDIPPEESQATAKINPRTRVGKAILSTAADYEIPPDDLADALEFAWEQRVATDGPERQKGLEAAHKLTGLYQSDVKWLKNSGFDHTSVKRAPARYADKLAHFDTFAQELARDFPALGLGDADDPNADFAAALWEILDTDRARAIPMDDPGLLRQAAEMVVGNRQYDQANVLTSSYEEFCKRGQVERYRRWVREREENEQYGKKPAKGQMGFEWKEDDHPRDDSGQFAEKEGGGATAEKAKEPGGPKPEALKPTEEPRSTAPKSLFPDDQDIESEVSSREAAADFEAGRWKGDASEKGKQGKLFDRMDWKPDQQGLFAERPASEADVTPDFAADKSPREAVSESLARQADSEYAFARSSSIPNAGEDVLGSARHTRNAWRGLAEAEEDGTAEELVTRDKLLKNEPHNLMVHVMRNPLTAVAMHYALRNFPSKPGYGNGKPSTEDAQKNRRQYLDAYQRIKEKAQDLAAGQEDPVKASKDLGSFVSGLIREYRGQEGSSYIAKATATDKYNATANSLISLSNRLTSTYKKTSITKQTAEFAKAFELQYGDMEPVEKSEKLVEHASDIIEGMSLNKTLGIEGPKGKTFNSADLYVKSAERKGGPELPTKSAKETTHYMLDSQKFRAIQFGNSVSDEEREHHVQKCAEAFADLADILDIPEEYVSWKGKLAVAFGARGKGSASAHYEPGQQVINLTRKSGAGALAHEWGHFFDNVLGGSDLEGMVDAKTGKAAGASYFSEDYGIAREYRDGKTTKIDKTGDPLWKAFDEVRKAQESSGFKQRLSRDLRSAKKDGLIGEKKIEYFNQERERFARCFERYVQTKLEAAGRKNTYLAGMLPEKYAGSGMEFWPTDDEVKAMTPAFDKIFKEFRAGIEKGKYWLRETGDRLVLERYGKQRNADADTLPGGRADSLPSSDFDPASLAKGIEHELEHTDDPDIAREIAQDHLAEDPDYYEKLEVMESAEEIPVDQEAGDDAQDDDAPEDDLVDTLAERVAKAARKTIRKPSDAEKEAGNYRKGKCRLHGLEIAIETPQGATRSGKNKETGEEWSIKTPWHYGYIKRTESEADGDHIDIFLGPDIDSEVVFVIDQVRPDDGGFDEHKCMLGWKSAEAAKAAYHDCYQDGWQGFEGITPMTIPQFREWCERGDTGKRVAAV